MRLNCITLGQQIRDLRQKHHLSQRELASLCGVSRSLLSQIENARAVPSLDVMIRIANYFHVSIVYMLTPTLRTSAR